MEIISDYPLWFVLLCLLLGLAFAVALYYRDSKLAVPAWLSRLLAVFRFLSVSIIAFLLIGPLIKQNFQNIEKPVIVFAQDNSSSILLREDSSYMYGDYVNSLKIISDDLEDDFDFVVYCFDDIVRENDVFAYDGKQTNISQLITNIEQRFNHKNLGALIIASDGIYNTGMNPVYTARNVNFPVYAVGLGDTSIKKDLIIDDVNHNSIAFQNNDFPVEVVIRADKCKGERSAINIYLDGQMIESKSFFIDNNDFIKTFQFSLNSGRSGVKSYKLVVSNVKDELITANNSIDFFIDIIDDKQKILILSKAPHPDIGALKSAIGSNVNYSLEDFLIRDFNKNIRSYNLVILYQLPTIDIYSRQLMRQIEEAQIPVLFIIGKNTDLSRFNQAGTGLKIFGDNKTFENVYSHLNNYFTLFKIPEDIISSISRFPPLYAPFGTYDIVNASQVLLFQKIGNVETDKPLIAFVSMLEKKYSVITGEGLWRWRIADYEMNANHDAFNELIRKIIQYLTLKADKSYFRVETESEFYENQNVVFSAELYNENYELVNEADVNIIISDKDNNQYPFVFGRQNDRYILDAGSFPAGQYTYKASTVFGENEYSDEGGFIIKALNIEANQSRADFNLLYRLAKINGGELIYKNQIVSIPDILRQRDDIHPIVYYSKRYTEIMNIFTVLIIIISLLAVEWFIRRWSGTY